MSKEIFDRAVIYHPGCVAIKLKQNHSIKYINQEVNDISSGFYVSFVVEAKRNVIDGVDCIDVYYRLESYEQYVEREGVARKKNPYEKFFLAKETYALGSDEYVNFMDSMALSLHYTRERDFFLEDVINVGELVLLEYDENKRICFSLRRPLYIEDRFSDEELDFFNEEMLQEKWVGESTLSEVMSVSRNAMILNSTHKMKVCKPSPDIHFDESLYKTIHNDSVPSGWYVSVALFANFYGPEGAEEGIEVMYKLEPYDLYFNRINEINNDNSEVNCYVIKHKFAFDTKEHEDFTAAMSTVIYDNENIDFSIYDINNAHEVVVLKRDENQNVIFSFRRPLYFEDRLTNEKIVGLSKIV